MAFVIACPGTLSFGQADGVSHEAVISARARSGGPNLHNVENDGERWGTGPCGRVSRPRKGVPQGVRAACGSGAHARVTQGGVRGQAGPRTGREGAAEVSFPRL